MVCDYATRYPEVMATRSVEVERAADVVSRVGIPNKTLTDQGMNFTSQLLKQLHRIMHVQHICTSSYHLPKDGLVE